LLFVGEAEQDKPPGADLNVAQRPGWRAGKPAINGQASNSQKPVLTDGLLRLYPKYILNAAWQSSKPSPQIR
jgi:hypothetical protein